MASAYEIPNLRFSGESGAAIARRRFVKINSNGEVVQAAAGDQPVGVSSQPCTAAGQVAEIYDGIVMVEAGGAVTAGTQVMSDANGKAVTYSNSPATNVVAGYAITGASAAGELISVKVY